MDHDGFFKNSSKWLNDWCFSQTRAACKTTCCSTHSKRLHHSCQLPNNFGSCLTFPILHNGGPQWTTNRPQWCGLHVHLHSFHSTKLYCLVAIALPLEGSGPHLLHGSLGSLEYKLQTAFWLIQSFSTAELCPTDNSKPVVTYANSTSLQTHNHTKTSLLNFYRPDALPDARPTVSKHWRYRIIKIRQTSRDTWWPWNVSRNSALYFAAATGS